MNPIHSKACLINLSPNLCSPLTELLTPDGLSDSQFCRSVTEYRPVGSTHKTCLNQYPLTEKCNDNISANVRGFKKQLRLPNEILENLHCEFSNILLTHYHWLNARQKETNHMNERTQGVWLEQTFVDQCGAAHLVGANRFTAERATDTTSPYHCCNDTGDWGFQFWIFWN